MASTSTSPAYALGIDVSHYQLGVDWAQVLRDGRSFGFVKATEGASVVDTYFERNWQQMGEVGITRGAYHFFRAFDSADDNASNFLNAVSLIDTDLPPVIDIEIADGVDRAMLVAMVYSWLDTVEQETGRTPIVYTDPGFWATYMDASFGRYPLWIAHYTQHPQPLIPAGWDMWTFWQYASGESNQVHVLGVRGGVDASRYNGTHQQLVDKFGL